MAIEEELDAVFLQLDVVAQVQERFEGRAEAQPTEARAWHSIQGLPGDLVPHATDVQQCTSRSIHS